MGSKIQRQSAAFLLSLLAGCGSYDHQELPPPPATAGTGGGAGTGDPPPTSGTGGSVAGAGGSSAGAGGTMAGAGGSVAGAGGTAGATGGTAGAAGSGALAGMAGSGAAGSGAAGSAGGTGMCDAANVCGGDLVGTWTVAACAPVVGGMVDLTGLGLANDCTSAPVTSGSREITGTVTYNGDSTYTDETEMTGEEVYELPPACLVLSGTTTTCTDIAGPLRSVGFVTNECVDNPATGGCTCTATVDQTGGLGMVSYDAAESGTYAISSQDLSMSSYGEDAEYAYCVAGTVLTLNLTSVSRTGSLTSPIVLQK